MHHIRYMGVCAIAMAFVAPALAGTVTLTKRESVSHIELTGGYGPAQVGFEDGTLTPVTDLEPTSIVLSGSDGTQGRSAAYEVTFNAIWDQRQDYSFQMVGNDTVLDASGTLAVSMNSTWFNTIGGLGGAPATQFYTSSNWQSFEFVLDDATRFSFTGATADTQSLQMFRWFNDSWINAAYVVSPGSGVGFGNTGVMDAGRYMLRNTPNPVTRVQTSTTGNGWAYTLTLHDTVSAVPEPSIAASMLVGLSLMGWRLRRRLRR
jgi:hypothetical protein